MIDAISQIYFICYSDHVYTFYVIIISLLIITVISVFTIRFYVYVSVCIH